jgi:ABC-type polysaccharide/polyol phosphate transport system ATPase subunit
VSVALRAEALTKLYRRRAPGRRLQTLKSAFVRRAPVRAPEETIAALSEVSFAVERGELFGVVGGNGSGKSTLLELAAGILRPTSGTLEVDGRVTALIELGAGFHPEISGRENVFINGIMLGLSKREVQRRFDEIVAFAELEEFIDAPVKTYSSGMYMRLGFAVAIHVDPEVLLVDEVLAVGDQAFTHKCLDKFAEFRRRNKTVLLVTHSLDLVEKYCDAAVWLDKGRTRGDGEPKRVVAAYLIDVEQSEESELARAEADRVAASAKAARGEAAAAPRAESPEPRAEAREPKAVAPAEAEPEATVAEEPLNMFKAAEGRWGTREVEITDVQIVGADGQPGHVFQSGEAISVRMKIVAIQPVSDLVFGVAIFNGDLVCCYGTNTAIDLFELEPLQGDGEVTFSIDNLALVEGTYRLDLAAHKTDGYPYDYHRLLYTFRVKSRLREAGVCRLDHRWTFGGNVRLKPGA